MMTIKKNEFQYPPLVVTGKQIAAQGIAPLHQWLNTLDKVDRVFLEPYLAIMRAIAKEHDKVKR